MKNFYPLHRARGVYSMFTYYTRDALRAFAALTGRRFKDTTAHRTELHFIDEWLVFFDKRPVFIVKWIRCAVATSILTLAMTAGYAQTTVINDQNWSALVPQPTSATTVVVSSGATLTVDVPNAQANTLRLGCHNNCPGNPPSGNGTLVFDSNPNSQLTVSDEVVFGNVQGNRQGILDMSNGGTLIARSWTFYGGNFTPGTGLVEFTGNSIHPAEASLNTFYDLVISNGILETFTLSANLTVLNGLTFTGTLIAANNNVTIQGNWDNDGGTYLPGLNTTLFTGGAAQQITGGATFYNLAINNTAAAIYLDGDIIVANALTLTDGRLILGPYNLTMGAESVINGGSDNSYITTDAGGVLRRNLNLNDIGQTFNFAIGDSVYYSPMLFNLTNLNVGVDPYITVAVFGEAHPNINNVNPNAFYINRYWELDAMNLLNIEYQVEYFYRDHDVVGNENALYSGRWDGSAWEPYESADVTANRLFVNIGLITLGASHAFSGGDPGYALPVELSDFRAELVNDKVICTWTTETERNSAYFEVQRAAGDDNFETIHRVTAAGESTTPRDYKVADAQPPAGKLYYRLRQVDTDGTEEYFAPVMVHVHRPVEARDWIVYPNPATAAGSITLQGFPEDLQEVEILHVSGQTIWRTAIHQPDASVKLTLPQACETGMYFLRIYTPQGVQHKPLLVR